MQARGAKGFCFNCDEQFFLGRKCQPKLFLLLLDDDNSSDGNPSLDLSTSMPTDTLPPLPTSLLDPTPSTVHFHLSTEADSGSLSSHKFRFQASAFGNKFSVLVDSSSSHNVMQPRIASPIASFSIMVGNGAFLHCSGVCSLVRICLQGHSFSLPFFFLPIQGADLVLGVQWLQTLGLFLSNFSVPSMQFYHHRALTTLHGTNSEYPLPATYHQLLRLVSTDAVATYLAISIHHVSFQGECNSLSPSEEIQLLSNIPSDLHALLAHFAHVFSIPHNLPLFCPHHHHIHLIPGSNPVNVCPYHYP
ncbi:hypothetical protein Sango_2313000 [Sesamum angolense]|uniref:Uncharacterized protein n=1 Tax=Sesamum angolense TaxID=2727404 RepID=A0AAE1WAE7_9LAMI|nr:hypothetical protein Sango_2313000 [Sesamum angolense]